MARLIGSDWGEGEDGSRLAGGLLRGGAGSELSFGGVIKCDCASKLSVSIGLPLEGPVSSVAEATAFVSERERS